MDVRQRIAQQHYRPQPGETRDDMLVRFKNDCLQAAGLQDHPRADQIYAFAQRMTQCGTFELVADMVMELGELINGPLSDTTLGVIDVVQGPGPSAR